MNNKEKISANTTKKNKIKKIIPAAKSARKKPKPVDENSTNQSRTLPTNRGEQRTNTEFQSQMDKVIELIKEGNIRQAYSAIPKETKFPESVLQIEALKSDLMKRIWNL